MHTSLYRQLFTGFSLFITILFFSAPLYAASTCKLSFQMHAATSTVSLDNTISYTVITKNIGGSQCRDVSVSLFYANNETFISSSPVSRASNYYWYIGNLGSGKTTTIAVITKPTSGTTVVTEGCASARNASDACASETAAIQSTVSTLIITAASSTATSSGNFQETVASSTSSIRMNEQGIWVWNFPSQMNTATGDSQLKALASYGFTAVYITIDDYLDIAMMPEGATKTQNKAAYFAQLGSFIQKAQALGIQVDAEGGANNWAITENRWKGFALIDAVKEYNTLYPNQKLRGFQYDVEPHTLPDYETNEAARLTEYVEFVDQSMTRLQGSDVAFSVVIPHFFDDGQVWTPAISYNGTTTYTFNHLLSIMDKKQGSAILLMSYRNFFEGSNGTRQISETEVQEASAISHTRIIVGQETGNVDPSYITFYGQSKSDVLNNVSTIKTAFGNYSQFGGVAVHYLDSFLGMK